MSRQRWRLTERRFTLIVTVILVTWALVTIGMALGLVWEEVP